MKRCDFLKFKQIIKRWHFYLVSSHFVRTPGHCHIEDNCNAPELVRHGTTLPDAKITDAPCVSISTCDTFFYVVRLLWRTWLRKLFKKISTMYFKNLLVIITT